MSDTLILGGIVATIIAALAEPLIGLNTSIAFGGAGIALVAAGSLRLRKRG